MPKISTWRDHPRDAGWLEPALTSAGLSFEWLASDLSTLDLRVGVASGSVLVRAQYKPEELIEALKIATRLKPNVRAKLLLKAAEEAVSHSYDEALEQQILEFYVRMRQQRTDRDRHAERAKRKAAKAGINEVDQLELSVSTANVLKNNKITTIEQLLALGQAQALRFPGMGRKNWNEIAEMQTSLTARTA